MIVVFCVYNILKKSALPFSLNKIVYLFFLFFFGLSPALQFKNDISFFGAKGHLTESDFLFGNLITIAILLLYFGAYHLFSNKKKAVLNYKIETFNKKNNFSLNYKYLVLCSMSIVVLMLVYFEFNFDAIFVRKFLWQNKNKFLTPILSVISVVRGLPLLFFLYYRLYTKNRIIWVEILLLLLIIFCNFPTAIPRYKVAIIYLPIILVYVKQLYKPYKFSITFVLGFLTVFPYLSHFRYSNDFFPKKIFNFVMFTSGHFDTYQNSINVIKESIITYGNQLLGVVFFFVPRSLWQSKSLGSGHVLGEALEYEGFTNVAVSYFAEGYINFGFFGIFIFTLLLGVLNAKLDSYFWKNNNPKAYILITYLILIPFEFFLLRGSLLSSFSNFTGYFVFVVLLNLVFVKSNFFTAKIYEKN